MKRILFSLLIILIIMSITGNAAEVSAVLKEYLRSNQSATIWIYFVDKGPQIGERLSKPVELISERALLRRAKVLPSEQIVDTYDIPVNQQYIDSIQPFVNRLRITSCWLNAISAEVKADGIDRLKKLKFIKKLDLVNQFKKPLPDTYPEDASQSHILKKTSGIQYGSSFDQLAQINVPLVHERGFFGRGVLVCLLDNGFLGYKDHIAFNSLDVVDTWDFVNNDEAVDDYGRYVGGTHGTTTLSTIAGYAPGNLIGPAFKASYMLGKTEIENDDIEIRVEEDHWVAGLEWAEQSGADIVSSSLGYIDWYTWADMDGETALTTRHANMAVARGVLIVNSAGNEAKERTPNTLLAPADGKYVLAVAAVDVNNKRAGFSSYGPTADGRIKPDVAAMGYLVRIASPSNPNGFARASGTSFSCPLVAGVAAQMLSAFPELTPFELIQGLKKTASQANSPDNLLGWGIVNAEAAYIHFSNEKGNEQIPSDIILKQNYPNPFNGFTVVTYSVNSPSQVRLDLYDILGKKVLEMESRFEDHRGSRIVSATDLPSGVYYYRVSGKELSTGKNFSAAKKMIIIK